MPNWTQKQRIKWLYSLGLDFSLYFKMEIYELKKKDKKEQNDIFRRVQSL